MRELRFRARPAAMVALAALLLGANVEPVVGLVREGAIHCAKPASPDAGGVAGTGATSSFDNAAHDRTPGGGIDACGSAGDHCAHAHGVGLPGLRCPALTALRVAVVACSMPMLRSCSIGRSSRPPIA